MMKFLFKNAGGKLSKVIKVITLLEMIAAVISGIGIGFESVLGLVIAVAGPLIIWFLSLFMIGFLDMMSDISKIKDLAYEVYSSSSASESLNDNSKGWVCPKCSEHNNRGAVYCKNCGQKKA